MKKKVLFTLVGLLFLSSCNSLSPYTKFLIKENKFKPTPFENPKYYIKPKLWKSNQITYAWLGHATVLINMYGTTILTDPILLNRIGPPEGANNLLGIRRFIKLPVKISELPPIDIVLISHGHFDHLCRPSLRKIIRNQKQKPLIIVPRKTSVLLKKKIYRKVVELDWMKRNKQLVYKNVNVKAFRVEHYGHVPYKDRNRYMGSNGYIISSRGKRIVFFGDTSYRRYRNYEGRWHGKGYYVNWPQQLGLYGKEIHLCIIPIGDSHYYMNHIGPKNAIKLFYKVNGIKLLPIHYDTFLLSPRDKYPQNPKKTLLYYIKKYRITHIVKHKNLVKRNSFPEVGLTCYIR